MKKILALDIGDQWTGIAISDILGLLSKPYKTVGTKDLEKELKVIIEKEKIDEVIIGHPITMKGRESEQTKKTLIYKIKLEQELKNIKFILWDERLTSKRAETLSKSKTKEEKLRLHSVAAAFILDSYLEFLRFSKNI